MADIRAKIRIECPNCLNESVVDKARAGSQIVCQHCQSTLRVPPLDSHTVDDLPRSQNTVHRYKNCHYCGERVKLGAIKCRHCLEYLNQPVVSHEIVDEGVLSYKEILFCLGFTIFGCFYGFIVATANPRKGGKLIFTSIYGIALWFVSSLAIRLIYFTD